MLIDDDGDRDCPADHDMTEPHIVIMATEVDGESALMLCHSGWDVDDALEIMKHVTTLFYLDVVAYHAARN